MNLSAETLSQGQDPVVPTRILYGVFLLSGFAALLYQLVWQRALFTLYGSNAESVTVVVAAFMLGLGLGSYLGGLVSRRPNIPLIAVFGVVELLIGLFGVFSLALFAWVGSMTLGVSLMWTGVISFLVVLVPTCLMGSTLPLLVRYCTDLSGNVGQSVSTLYYVNTLGSAVACFVAGLFIFRILGMAGSVYLAAAMNAAIAFLVLGAVYGRRLR